jgi:hypothetical protein
MLTRLLALLLGAAAARPGQAPANDRDAEAKRRTEFFVYFSRTTPGYREIGTRLRARMQTLREQVRRRESDGKETACSQQILDDADWVLGDTADLARAARRLDDLEAVMAHPEEEAKARQQDPEDGGWGHCHSEWFFKVNATIDHITNPQYRDEQPRHPLHLLDRVNSPEKLTAYFDSLRVSDIAPTGRDNARELNESMENLGRLIVRGRPAYYHWDPRLKDTMMDVLLKRLRNPQTGWWGPRYVRDGGVQFVDGLSMTYHVVTMLNGTVPDLDKVGEHLLAVKDLDYPVGWLRGGKYSNHHEMDAIGLFRYAWPFMRDGLRKQAAAEIRKVVRWGLDESLKKDGSFQITGGDPIERNMFRRVFAGSGRRL